MLPAVDRNRTDAVRLQLDDGFICALKGGKTTQFFRYHVSDDTWQGIDTMPSIASTGRKKRVKGGGDLCRYDTRHVFALEGNKTLEFWYYYEPPLTSGSTVDCSRSALMPPAVRTAGTAASVAGLRPARITLDNDLSGFCRVTLYDLTG